MNKILQLLLLSHCLCWSASVNAMFTVKATVTGQKVTWEQAARVGNNNTLAPLSWADRPYGTQGVVAWVPGTFMSSPSTSISLNGSSASASLPITLSGMNYRYSASKFQAMTAEDQFKSACTTDNTNQNTGTVELHGNSCVSGTQLEVSGVSSTLPFHHYRPIFDISNTNIINALNGKPKDIYSGYIPFSAVIRYKNVYNMWVTRTFTDYLFVSIDYSPDAIVNIAKTGNGVMTPSYNTTNKTVSASTTYDFTVSGYFSNGLVLTMPTGPYELTNSTSTIPYQITCSGCADTNLVNSNGARVKATTTVGKHAGQRTSLAFSLVFSYSNIDGDTLNDGTYQDSFTMIVALGL